MRKYSQVDAADLMDLMDSIFPNVYTIQPWRYNAILSCLQAILSCQPFNHGATMLVAPFNHGASIVAPFNHGATMLSCHVYRSARICEETK